MTYRNHLSPPIFPYTWASDWGSDQYGLWVAFTYHGIRHAFRWIQPGTFMMGSPETEKGRWSNEVWHQVTLSKGFWLAETTVTQILWQVVMGENPSHFKGENRPIEQISWSDVQTFIGKLNQVHPDLRVCLPTESEWEYACRAGTQTRFSFGGKMNLGRGNYRGIWDWEVQDKRVPDKWGDRAQKETTDVASYSSNAWGLYDMHGNVWEFCQDEWQEKLSAELITNPLIIKNSQELGVDHVIRGGSWDYCGRFCRSASRRGYGADDCYYNVGFRLALEH